MSKVARKRSAVVKLKVAGAQRMPGHRIGSVFRDAEGLAVDYPDNPHGPLRARTTLQPEALAALSVGEPHEALLVFEEESSDRPIVVGLLNSITAPPAPPAPPSEPKLLATVDGKRVLIEGHDEIVLRCGEASITLRRNGRVVVRGAYLETRSRGVNRIKGGSVQIN